MRPEGGITIDALTVLCGDGAPEVGFSRALFIMVGAVPNTGWLADMVQLDDKGFVMTGACIGADSPYATSCAGIFAVGDVRAGSVKRVTSSAGEGSVVISRVWESVNG